MFLPLRTEAQPRPLLPEPPCEEAGHTEEIKESSQSPASSEALVLCGGPFWILQPSWVTLADTTWNRDELSWLSPAQAPDPLDHEQSSGCCFKLLSFGVVARQLLIDRETGTQRS